VKVLKEKADIIEKDKGEPKEKVEVTRLKGASESFGIHSDAEDDATALHDADIDMNDLVGGMKGGNMYHEIRRRWKSSVLKPGEMARFMDILKDVSIKINLDAMEPEEVSELVGKRDSYERMYRSSTSGHNRSFKKEDGKVLSLEANLRRMRCVRDKIDMKQANATGMISDQLARDLGREFHMVAHERDMIFARVV